MSIAAVLCFLREDRQRRSDAVAGLCEKQPPKFDQLQQGTSQWPTHIDGVSGIGDEPCNQPSDVQAAANALVNGGRALPASNARRVARWSPTTTFSEALPAFQIPGTSSGMSRGGSPIFVPLPFALIARPVTMAAPASGSRVRDAAEEPAFSIWYRELGAADIAQNFAIPARAKMSRTGFGASNGISSAFLLVARIDR